MIMPQSKCVLCEKRLKLHQRRPVNKHISKYLRKTFFLESTSNDFICGKCSRPAYLDNQHTDSTKEQSATEGLPNYFNENVLTDMKTIDHAYFNRTAILELLDKVRQHVLNTSRSMSFDNISFYTDDDLRNLTGLNKEQFLELFELYIPYDRCSIPEV
ncbi:hypothetical protein KUTeg_024102 [Tegillarca granosa]|uniref:Uncharacterized protein n=1 Tax=Tegillarca granosa TaxID=220873 RepID=A0ABQ9DZF9_TEGGR|nr:hypothetical protein KUTeg_024102 [Tegillarca granosa]